MKYKIKPSNRFKKDVRTSQKRGYDLSLLTEIIKKIADGEKLDEKHRDHALTGDYSGFRECHITPDWLLIYQIVDNELLLFLSRTGTHSDLF